MAGKNTVDLSPYIAKDGTYGLNLDTQYPLENLYNEDERFQTRSDADDQLLLHFVFSEKVKLNGFSVKAPEGEMRPTKIRLFINQVSMDFSDAEELPAAFEMELKEEDMTGDKLIALRIVKFNSCDSITVFVENSEGGDISALSSVKFFGELLHGTNMSELKKSG